MGKWSKHRAGRAPGLAGTPWGSECQQSNKTQNVKPDPSSKAYEYQISVEALAGPFSNRLYKIPLLCGGHTLLVQGAVKHRAAGGDTTGCSPGMGTVPVFLQHSCPRAAPATLLFLQRFPATAAPPHYSRKHNHQGTGHR